MATPALQSQNGAAIGAQHLPVQHRSNAPARLHRVQVGRKHYRLAGPLQPGNDVVEGVVADLKAQGPEAGGHLPVHFIFFPGRAVDADQVHQGLYQPLSVSQISSSDNELPNYTLGRVGFGKLKPRWAPAAPCARHPGLPPGQSHLLRFTEATGKS